MMTAEEFEKFCKIAKANGVKTFSADGLQITFNEEPQQVTLSQSVQQEGIPTEDQFLLWSTDTMPDRKGVKDGN